MLRILWGVPRGRARGIYGKDVRKIKKALDLYIKMFVYLGMDKEKISVILTAVLSFILGYVFSMVLG